MGAKFHCTTTKFQNFWRYRAKIRMLEQIFRPCCKISLKKLVKNDEKSCIFCKSLGLGPSLGLGWATGLGLGLGWLTWSRSRYKSGLGLGKEILVSVDPWSIE